MAEKDIQLKQVLKRFPPGDRWTPADKDEPVFSNLTEGIEWVFQSTNERDYVINAAEGKVYANATEPWYPELIHTLAVLYSNMNLVDEGSLAHREVSAIFPNSRWAKKSLQLLKDQK